MAGWRVKLARELTARAKLRPAEALNFEIKCAAGGCRLGVTGPPGAGKSTLIGLLTERWVAAGSKVGVLAVDPTSPFSGGSLLGDRVRMEGISGADKAFIRSAPSRSAVDGLCPNIVPMLEAFDDAAFDRVVLETVGIGQVSYEARDLVDTFILVLVPESGDTVQAMKAGIAETADIYVVNKADRSGANKLVSELNSIAKWRSKATGWRPPVLAVSTVTGMGVEELDSAIDEHFAKFDSPDRRKDLWVRRQNYHLKSSVQHRLDEIIKGMPAEVPTDSSERYRHVLSLLAEL